MCIVLEVVGEGELWDYIAIPGPFAEMEAHSYFQSLIAAVEYIHGRGVCHRDIKLQNLLLNREFMLKLADFGFATLMEGKDQTGVLRERLGTEGYMAPEIYLLKYVGSQVDVFAAGVVLFTIYSGHPPFSNAVATDPHYKLFRSRNYEQFWKLHSKGKPSTFVYNESFRSLIEGMLAW